MTDDLILVAVAAAVWCAAYLIGWMHGRARPSTNAHDAYARRQLELIDVQLCALSKVTAGHQRILESIARVKPQRTAATRALLGAAERERKNTDLSS